MHQDYFRMIQALSSPCNDFSSSWGNLWCHCDSGTRVFTTSSSVPVPRWWTCKAQKTLRQNRELDIFFTARGSFFQDCHKFEVTSLVKRGCGVLLVLSARRWRLCCIHGWQRQRVVLARNPFVRRVAILQADTCGNCTRYLLFYLLIPSFDLWLLSNNL